MRTNLLTFVGVVVLGAATLRAQTPADQPSVYIPPAPAASPTPYVPPPPPPPYGYGYNNNYNNSGVTLAGAITLPYAFNWKAAGVSAELGGLWDGRQFLGGEVSYYDGNAQRYFVFGRTGYIGSFKSSQELTTVDLAYKYFVPLWNLGPRNPVSFYIGASGGVGFVSYSDNGAGYGFANSNNNNGDFTAEFVAGLNLSISRNAVIRLGYRYVGVDDVSRFNQRVDIDSSVLEAGIGLRF